MVLMTEAGEVVEDDLRGPVLALCTHNSVRSPIAEYFLSRMLPGDVRVVSAGLEPQEMDPFALAVMQECGADLSGHAPKGCDEAVLKAFEPFGLVIALSRPAVAKAREIGKRSGAPVEYWDVPEPPSLMGFGGSRDQILEAYRAIRDDIARHIRNRFDLSSPG